MISGGFSEQVAKYVMLCLAFMLCAKSGPDSQVVQAVCRLYLSPHRKLQSTIANTTRHPMWHEKFQLLVSSHKQDSLTLIMFDHDRVRQDDKLGR